MIATTGLGIAGFATGTAFSAPACGPSKEKAVRYAGLVIDLSKEAVPLLDLLGASQLAETVSVRVIPALEKLKDALAKTDIPEARTTLETVRGALGAVATALLNLPESPRRTTIVGVIASVRLLLLTVEAFIASEMAPVVGALSVDDRQVMTKAIHAALEVTGP
jgi:hypothetical protein